MKILMFLILMFFQDISHNRLSLPNWMKGWFGEVMMMRGILLNALFNKFNQNQRKNIEHNKERKKIIYI